MKIQPKLLDQMKAEEQELTAEVNRLLAKLEVLRKWIGKEEDFDAERNKPTPDTGDKAS